VCGFPYLGQYFLIQLSCPLDVHSVCCSEIGLLNRKQNDKALCRIGFSLRLLDPAKYSFALFGLGILKVFSFLKKEWIVLSW
jgi:hypothetical protein